MKTLPIYLLISGLSLTTSLSLPAADPAPAKKATPPATAETKTKTPDKTKPAAKKSSPTPPKSAPTTHTLKKGPLEIKVELSGIFDAVKSTPISLAPKRWSAMSVITAVPHGATVKKGDVIIQLDTKKLEKAVRNAELAQPLSDLGLKLAELELIELEKSTPLNLASSRRAKQQAEENLTYYEKTDKAQNEKSAKENLKQSTQYLSYVKEELDQLQKMYAADDLTEETEEIIVTRAKNSVAGAQFRRDSIKLSTARTLDTTLPRKHQSLKEQVKTSAIAWEKSSKTLPQALKRKHLEI
ncbi:MAG: biotin/lipoyl-binding protein, partial [Verrucomicrobia bacterium]|nr:biotin/lipoyl-binding protein [Verrucomicrobiota bacterium]